MKNRRSTDRPRLSGDLLGMLALLLAVLAVALGVL